VNECNDIAIACLK